MNREDRRPVRYREEDVGIARACWLEDMTATDDAAVLVTWGSASIGHAAKESHWAQFMFYTMQMV